MSYRDIIINAMAAAMWEDALFTIMEDVQPTCYNSELGTWQVIDFVNDHNQDVPESVKDEARQWLAQIEAFNGTSNAQGEVISRDIEDIARELGADSCDDDLETLGYYCAMQYMGHGVAWSDSREGELQTPYGESSQAAFEAVYALLDTEDRLWYDTKELSGWDAVNACIGRNWKLRMLTSHQDGGLNETIIDRRQAEQILYTHAADATDAPLIMVADWRK